MNVETTLMKMLLHPDVCVCIIRTFANTNCGAANMLVNGSLPAQVQSLRLVTQRRILNTVYIICT
jgi:hypothetical protein